MDQINTRQKCVTRYPLAALALLSLFANGAALAQSGGLTIPHVGTRLIPVPESTTLSFDKPYEKLTPAEKQLIRAKYDNLGPRDEPPYPINGMKPISDDLGKIVERTGVKGRFQALARIDKNGDAKTVSIYALPNDQLKDALSYVLLHPKYKPAKCNGAPCEMDFLLDVNFE